MKHVGKPLDHLHFSKFPLLYVIVFFAICGCDSCDDPDTIVILNDNGKQVGLLVDGADGSGDFEDQTIITSNTEYEFSYDVLSRTDDKEEVTGFTKGRPPFVRNPMLFHEGRDLISIDFQDEIVLDFTVWIVDVNWANGINNRTNETLDALAWADDWWYTERMGVTCGDIRIVDKTDDADADDLRDHEEGDDDYFENLADGIGFDDGRINIYLVRKCFGSRYYGVGERPGDQLAMGMYTGSDDLLMHEIAHNFNLEHTDDNSNFNSKNVAISVGSAFTKRKYWTEGQTFRCHTAPGGAINAVYNARPGEYTVSCSHSNSTTPECPKIHKRIWADGTAFDPN